jgi:uncharacterized protein (TIGR02646 family)
MIKIEKDFMDVPKILTSDNRENAFDANVLSASYSDEKNLYKVGSVQKKLNELYHLKCGYCEKTLLDTPKHIEHYRPKKTYYWLAYSWDNLLLSCGECNSAKGDRFEISDEQVSYADESFEQIHTFSNHYDSLEKPLIINPEKEDVLEKLHFNNKGEIFSDDARVAHTIGACNLDREPLNKLREAILIDFVNEMEGHYFYFKEKKDISRFIPTVKQFVDNCKRENQFYAFRLYILNNLELFFENRILQKVVEMIIKRV